MLGVLLLPAGPLLRAVPGPGAPLERVRLQLKWQHQFQFAGYYAAIAQGYYREAGLEVELIEARPGVDPTEAVLAGHAEFGVGTSELLLLRGKGRPVVVLAAIYQHSPLVLLAAHGPGVEDLHDLHDKPIMVEPQSAELFAYFKNEGIDPARLHVVHHTFEVKDLLEGRVAAMTGYSTDEAFLVRQAGFPVMTFTPRAGGIDFYGDNLFTLEGQVRQQPARTRAFLEASLKGWDYAVAHPEEMVDLILRNYSRRKSREHLLFEAEQTIQLMHPNLIETGHVNPGRWRHIADTYAEFGMLVPDFPLDGFLYERNPRVDLRRAYGLVAVFGLVALGALFWLLPLARLNRRLREGEKQYRELAENAPFPVSISDLESGRVLFVNRRAGDLLAFTPAESTNPGMDDFYANPADREALVAAVDHGGRVTDLELCFRARDGREIWTLLSAGSVQFAGRRGLIVSFMDITGRRAMESALRRAKEAAETADAAKSRYLAVLSHEIRTPMNGILGLVGLMRAEPDAPDQRENLEIVERSAQSLLRLVNDLLDWARIEAGRMEIEESPTDVAALVRELCILFHPAAEAKAVVLCHQVGPDVPPAVMTDPLRLRQILSNLLSNAIKFTHQGAVEVRVTKQDSAAAGAPDGPCRLRFEVRDSGIGIAPAALGRLFAPYAQADASVARTHGGTGLGLSISRRLAGLLGGDIAVESQPGRGSVFTVDIQVRAVT